jgi:DNA-binding CsgD family transcriptional regulator
MAEALRLLLLILALGTGLAAITFCGLLFQARRMALFRALLANIALFNLLILAGLVFWYSRLHLELTGPDGTTVVILSGMAVLKAAWLVAFVSLVRILPVEGAPPRRGLAVVGVGVGVLVVHWTLLGISRLSGREPWFAFGFVEVAILLGTASASGWLLWRAGRAAGHHRRSMLWFAGFHLAILASMAIGLLWGWLRPGTAPTVPVTSSLLMMAYNLFPLVWVRSFHSREAREGSDALDRYGITPREREIIELICVGKTNQEIAEQLFISLATVKDHNHNIFRKTGVRNRVQLVNLFRGA